MWAPPGCVIQKCHVGASPRSNIINHGGETTERESCALAIVFVQIGLLSSQSSSFVRPSPVSRRSSGRPRDTAKLSSVVLISGAARPGLQRSDMPSRKSRTRGSAQWHRGTRDDWGEWWPAHDDWGEWHGDWGATPCTQRRARGEPSSSVA